MEKKIEKLKNLKLLFVDDEKVLLDIITDTFVKLDTNFLTASNGKEALDLINSNNDISVIVTDINMPIMNGLEMMKVLNESNNEIPVIFMSAHTELNYIEEAEKLGGYDYLLKPFDFIKFIDILVKMDIKDND
ncbi:MAG: response regulator [Arcobacter sp.]|nr:response regulator [Arcobacter sp.]